MSSVAAPLRIGIDARELLGEATGVGRYLGELLRRWVRRPDAASRQFTLYTPEPLPFMATVPEGASVRELVVGSGRGTWWEQTHLRRAVRADPPDVFFASAYTAPLALGVPLAVAIHDVSFAAHPEWFRPREGARRRLLTRQAARAAEVIFTISEFSKREIVERLAVSADKIGHVSEATPRRPRPPPRTSRSSSSSGRSSTGGACRRRLRRLPPPRAHDRTRGWHDRGADRSYLAARPGRSGRRGAGGARVELKQYVSEDELEALYCRASVFVFLSEYEGFGLTPLEASAGVPIVVLDTPVAREVYGNAAWYVAPDDDVRSAGTAIRRLLEDADKREQVLGNAAAVLARYSWDATADATLAGIEGIARR